MAEWAGVIECRECGHDILRVHAGDGCHHEDCPCRIAWIRADKRILVREDGYDY
jgi:hypothetical protein